MHSQCLCMMQFTQACRWIGIHTRSPPSSVSFKSVLRLMYTSVAAYKWRIITRAGCKRMAAGCLTLCAKSTTMHALNQPDLASIHVLGHLQPMSKQSL